MSSSRLSNPERSTSTISKARMVSSAYITQGRPVRREAAERSEQKTYSIMDNGSLDSQCTDSQYVRNLGVEDYAVPSPQSSPALEPAVLLIKTEPITPKLEFEIIPPSALPVGTESTVTFHDHEAVITVKDVPEKTASDSNKLLRTLQEDNRELKETVSTLEWKLAEARRERRWMRAMLESFRGAVSECNGHHRYRWPIGTIPEPGPDDFYSSSPEPDTGSQPLDLNGDETDWA